MFYRLGDLSSGDLIHIERGGELLVYQVQSVRSVQYATPLSDVLVARSVPSTLTPFPCGGPFAPGVGDWWESRRPRVGSTLYALVPLAGLATSGLAVGILLAVYLRRGPLRGVISKDHLDDMGKIGIASALFWGYIWYCQSLLIWSPHMPEETPSDALRTQR